MHHYHCTNYFFECISCSRLCTHPHTWMPYHPCARLLLPALRLHAVQTYAYGMSISLIMNAVFADVNSGLILPLTWIWYMLQPDTNLVRLVSSACLWLLLWNLAAGYSHVKM